MVGYTGTFGVFLLIIYSINIGPRSNKGQEFVWRTLMQAHKSPSPERWSRGVWGGRCVSPGVGHAADRHAECNYGSLAI